MNQNNGERNGALAIIGCCIAIFWPGALTFGFPGVMASLWQEMFHVGSGATGATIFFMLSAVGIFMFLAGRWQERYGIRRMIILGILLTSIGCILAGWRSASPMPLYFLPAWGPMLVMAAMPVALILLCAGQGASHLRRWLVHPQLLGTLLWACAHLAVNSEARSLVLFGGIGAWALVSIVWATCRSRSSSSVPPLVSLFGPAVLRVRLSVN